MGSPAYAAFTLEEVCLVIDGMFLGKVAEDTPLATRGAAAVAEQFVYLVLSYELMGRGDKLCVGVKLNSRQKLAFERREDFVGLVVVEAQDIAVCLVCHEEIPVLGNQRFALPVVCEHRRDVLGNIGKQAAFYAVKAGEKVIFMSVREVAVEVNYLLCQQFALRRGSALKLPLTSVLSGVQQLRDAFGCDFPRNYLRVACIPCCIALVYAYPVRAHPCSIALAVHADAHAAAIDRGQKCGYLVKRALLLKLRGHALVQIARVLAHAEYSVNDLLRA